MEVTRDELIKTIGEAKVAEIETKNADFSHRQYENVVEFESSVIAKSLIDSEYITAAAFYYQKKSDVEEKDLEDLTWTIAKYEIL